MAGGNKHQCHQEGLVAQVLGFVKEVREDVRKIADSVSELNVKFGEMYGTCMADLAAVKELGKERYDTHAGEIKCLWERLDKIKPESTHAEIAHLHNRVEELKDAIRENSETNKSQDARTLAFLLATLKWVGGIAAAVIITWFTAKKL